MASISSTVLKDGSRSFRVGYRDSSGKLCWTPTLRSPEGAIALKGLIERLGYEAALKILHARNSSEQVLLVRDLLDLYLDYVSASATPGTVADYRRLAARTWLPHLGEFPIKAVTKSQVVKWVAWQRQQETARSQTAIAKAREWNEKNPQQPVPVPEPVYYSRKSLKNAQNLLSQMLKFAVDSDEIDLDRNVAHAIRLPSDSLNEHEMEIFTPAEFDRFVSVMDPHYRLLVKFLVVTGARFNEASALQVRDFDLDSATPSVQIRRAWKKGEKGRYLGTPKSRRGFRTIFLGESLRAPLRGLLLGRAAQEFAFTSPQGEPVKLQNFYWRHWRSAIEASGFTKRLTPNSLRHTSASWMLMAGVHPQVVQHRLGHESLDTTSKVYAHLLIDAQLPAAQAMDRHMATVSTLRPAAADPIDGSPLLEIA